MTIKVASWFLNKNFSQNERYAISTCDDAVIERETEKALMVVFRTEYGTIRTWLPKSVATVEQAAPPVEEIPQQVIEIGQAVEHKTFGSGVVTGIEDGVCTVRFGKATKRILATALTVA